MSNDAGVCIRVRIRLSGYEYVFGDVHALMTDPKKSVAGCTEIGARRTCRSTLSLAIKDDQDTNR